jgi:hypothetical protein
MKAPRATNSSKSDSVVLNVAGAPSIISNVEGMLDGASAVKLAVGYLFVEGLTPLISSLAQIPKTELLIGNVVNRLTDEQIRRAGNPHESQALSEEDILANYRIDRNRAAAETALNLRQTFQKLPQNSATSAVVVGLAQLILGGRLHVRLSTQCRLHAKVSLVEYPDDHKYSPGRAIVGTTNITMPVTKTIECPVADIDVLVEGKQNCDAVNAWFESHWSEAQDFHRELFDELGRAWPLAATS